MALIVATRTKETASNKPNASTAFNLPGSADTGFRTFASQCSDGDTVEIRAQNSDGSLWEEGLYTFTTGTPDTLVRTTVYDSSNSGSAVDFSGSASDVYITIAITGRDLNDLNNSIKNHIAGLKVKWNSNTQIAVEAGSAYVEESISVVELASEQTINPSLSASSWHYVYLKTDGTCEVSTTAPTAYSGAAMSKNTSGQKYRLVGQFRTDSSSNILEFTHEPSIDSWLYPRAAHIPTYRVLSNGKATTSTQVSLATLIPPVSRAAWLKASSTETTEQVTIGDGRTLSDISYGFFTVVALVRSSGLFPTDSTQHISYIFSSTPTGGFYIDVLGYSAGR